MKHYIALVFWTLQCSRAVFPVMMQCTVLKHECRVPEFEESFSIFENVNTYVHCILHVLWKTIILINRKRHVIDKYIHRLVY
jgi:hypothetical protein